MEEVEEGWGRMRCKGVGVEEVEKGWRWRRCEGVGGGRGGSN